jgi:glycosyltransferase involved in cell wall biosynthesis
VSTGNSSRNPASLPSKEVQPVRIAFVTETWLPSTDGVVTRLTATARELVRAGHQVLVIAPTSRACADRDLELAFPDVTLRTVPTVGFRFLYGGKGWGLPLPRVGQYLRQFSPDVVHVVNPALLGIGGVLAARWQHRPLVASYHTDLARHAVYYHLGWLRPIIWALLRILHGAAAVNLATSSTARRELTAHGIAGVRLWPRGLDLELFQPRSTSGSSSPRNVRPVALYVGRLAADKGLHRLDCLADPSSGMDLVLVGDGPQREELKRRFPSAVRFTGELHGTALAETYQSADVFVFPSTTETLGLVLLEALATGLPVVAAESPASREILAGRPAARLFAPDRPEQLLAAVRELLDSPDALALASATAKQTRPKAWVEATAVLLEHYRFAVAAEPASSGTEPSVRRQLRAITGIGTKRARRSATGW